MPVADTCNRRRLCVKFDTTGTSLEWRDADEELVEDRAERPPIDAEIHLLNRAVAWMHMRFEPHAFRTTSSCMDAHAFARSYVQPWTTHLAASPRGT